MLQEKSRQDDERFGKVFLSLSAFNFVTFNLPSTSVTITTARNPQQMLSFTNQNLCVRGEEVSIVKPALLSIV